MKAHQSDKDADEGRVERADLQGNRMADVADSIGTGGRVPLEPSEEWRQWGTVCRAVRNFWLLVGPELRVRPEQWPRVGLPAPEPVPGIVETAKTAALPAAPFVVEHETYAICLDCQRHVCIRAESASPIMP
eukprot:750492-Amphidinium_carterae.1